MSVPTAALAGKLSISRLHRRPWVMRRKVGTMRLALVMGRAAFMRQGYFRRVPVIAITETMARLMML
jgi:hypothetical protein